MKTLLVEDDLTSRRLIEHVLRARGHDVTACSDAESAWRAYSRNHHPLVILDWILPGSGIDGLELCRRIRQVARGPRCVVIVTTSRSEPDDLVSVLNAGADDYIGKPLDVRLLEVRLTIAERQARRLLAIERAEEQVSSLRQLLNDTTRLEGLIGGSEPMAYLFRLIRDLSAVDSTVLIDGETGTGKELVARAIHALSRRHPGPFVAVNCASLNESLSASQLFGHKRGSFTGAVDNHRGFFEAASGGTILLDEIGDLPLSMQATLLRVLQEREVVRVGQSTPVKVDVRILAATHRDLSHGVANGTFRADLYYRIRVARIRVPPLRERRDDIPLLAAEFLRRSSAESGKSVMGIDADAMRRLSAYEWPGNIRELQSAIEYGVVHTGNSVLAESDLPPELASSESNSSRPQAPLDSIDAAIAESKGNRGAAAKRLGISRATFYRRLAEARKHGVS